MIGFRRRDSKKEAWGVTKADWSLLEMEACNILSVSPSMAQ